jgi:hypothetical protein
VVLVLNIGSNGREGFERRFITRDWCQLIRISTFIQTTLCRVGQWQSRIIHCGPGNEGRKTIEKNRDFDGMPIGY